MRVGAHCELIRKNQPYRECFERYASYGAEGVEIVMRDGAQLNLTSKDSDFRDTAALASDYGLKIVGLTAGYTWQYPLTSSSAEIRQKGIDALKRQIEGTALIGSDSLLVVPGYAETTYLPDAEKTPVPVATDRALEGLSKVTHLAETVGVSLNVEVVWGGMLRTPETMKAFLDALQSPAVGFYMDSGNVYPEGNPEQWIRTLAGYVRRVHLKDYCSDRPNLEVFCSMGEGIVPFEKVLEALRGIGYDGWLGAEHHIFRSETDAKHSIGFIRNLIEA